MKSNLTSKYVANLTIENFPSRVELFALLNNFLEKSDFPKDYTNDNKDSSITFSFLNTDVAYEFLKHLNIEKLKNSLYAKLKTNMSIDVLKTYRRENHSKSVAISERNTKHSGVFNHSSNYSTIERNTSKSVIKKEKKFDTSILRISTPYISDEEKMKKEKHEGKKKWIVQKDFNKFIGKASSNKFYYIRNYVNLTPSEPPVLHQFREIKKDKWIAKNNFHV